MRMVSRFFKSGKFCQFFLLLAFICIPLHAEQELTLNPHDLAIVDSNVEEIIEDNGLVMKDASLYNLVNRVLGRLCTESGCTVKIKIIETSDVNAFSLSDGTIYISLVLFGLIDNEDQLAFLIAHEMSHINQMHHIKSQYELHEQTLKAARGQIIAGLFGMYLPAENLARVALAGFSKTLETEADNVAMRLIVKKGYNGWKAREFFRTLHEWINYEQKKTLKIYSTHPQFNERYAYCKQLLNNLYIDSTYTVNTGEYFSVIEPFYGRISTLLAGSNKVNELKNLAEKNIARTGDQSVWYFVKGKIIEQYYPLDSLSQGLNAFKKALNTSNNCIESYREIGWLFLKNNQRDSAFSYLKKYLELNPTASDTAIVNFYLRQN